MDARQVILEPVVSEKSYALMSDGKYTFRVDDRAHKTQIARADFFERYSEFESARVKARSDGAGNATLVRHDAGGRIDHVDRWTIRQKR